MCKSSKRCRGLDLPTCSSVSPKLAASPTTSRTASVFSVLVAIAARITSLSAAIKTLVAIRGGSPGSKARRALYRMRRPRRNDNLNVGRTTHTSVRPACPSNATWEVLVGTRTISRKSQEDNTEQQRLKKYAQMQCGNRVARNAKNCPKCGHRPFSVSGVSVIVIVFAIIIVYSMYTVETTPQSQLSPAQQAAKVKNEAIFQ
jgi:ribosomal protein L40E